MNSDALLLRQGTDEWRQARIGSLGASRIADILAKTKNGFSASRSNLLAELVSERLTGIAAQSYTNSFMEWGLEQETYARGMYEITKDTLVDQVGLIVHPTIIGTHASPDGLVGEDGLIEIKSPTTSTHIATLLAGAVPSKYIPQMAWQMACTGRKWCDFCSYDPRLPEDLRLFVKRVERDDKYIADLEAEVERFLDEVTRTIILLRKAA